MRAGRAVGRLSAVFLDRDGVINRKAPEGDYVTSWEEFEFLPGALDGVRLLTEAGLMLVVATNQRGVAHGRLTEDDLADIHARMRAGIEDAGGRIAGIYHCPHEGGCECRKPGVALFERAARDLGLELSETAVVGDRAADMEAAERIGALKVLVGGHDEPMPAVDFAAPDLISAARWLAPQALSSSSRSSAS